MEELDPGIPLRLASANVHSKVFDDEVVILEMRTGTYFSLRGTGLEVWKLVERNATPARISESMGARYEAPAGDISSAVESLLAELAEAELIVGDPSIESNGAAPEITAKAPFTTPEIERFTDMQELLLLDPIHEVNDSGWPHAPANP